MPAGKIDLDVHFLTVATSGSNQIAIDSFHLENIGSKPESEARRECGGVTEGVNAVSDQHHFRLHRQPDDRVAVGLFTATDQRPGRDADKQRVKTIGEFSSNNLVRGENAAASSLNGSAQ